MRFHNKSSSYHHYALVCLYYACTMSTMPVQCLLHVLCLFITTDADDSFVDM